MRGAWGRDVDIAPTFVQMDAPCTNFNECPSSKVCYPSGVIDFDGPRTPGCHCPWASGQAGDDCGLTHYVVWPIMGSALSMLAMVPAFLLVSRVLMQTLSHGLGCGFALFTVILLWVGAVAFIMVLVTFLLISLVPITAGPLLIASDIFQTIGASTLISAVFSVSLRWIDLVMLSCRGVMLDAEGALRRSIFLLRAIACVFAAFSLAVVLLQASNADVTDGYMSVFYITYLSMGGLCLVTVVTGASLITARLRQTRDLHRASVVICDVTSVVSCNAAETATTASMLAHQRSEVVQRTAVGLVAGFVVMIAAGATYYLALGKNPRQVIISLIFLFLGNALSLTAVALYAASTLPSREDAAAAQRDPGHSVGSAASRRGSSWASGRLLSIASKRAAASSRVTSRRGTSMDAAPLPGHVLWARARAVRLLKFHEASSALNSVEGIGMSSLPPLVGCTSVVLPGPEISGRASGALHAELAGGESHV